MGRRGAGRLRGRKEKMHGEMQAAVLVLQRMETRLMEILGAVREVVKAAGREGRE